MYFPDQAKKKSKWPHINLKPIIFMRTYSCEGRTLFSLFFKKCTHLNTFYLLQKDKVTDKEMTLMPPTEVVLPAIANGDITGDDEDFTALDVRSMG